MHAVDLESVWGSNPLFTIVSTKFYLLVEKFIDESAYYDVPGETKGEVIVGAAGSLLTFSESPGCPRSLRWSSS